MPVADTVTLMFTDLVGSTELLVALGEDRYDKVRDEHDKLVGGAITAHGGRIVKHTGDGYMAAFAGAADAVSAAGEILRRVANRNAGSDVELGVRIGISAGDVTERAGDYHGVVTIEAARLCAAASSGQILASQTVGVLAGSRGNHDFVPLGELELKGLPPTLAVALRWCTDAPVNAPPRAPRGNLPASLDRFIGRQHDIAAIPELLSEHRLITLTGPGGSGKTRLALEVARGVADNYRDGVWIVELAPVEDKRVVAAATMTALGLHNESAAADALRTHLARRDTLVVFDNCEHLVGAVAALVADLLAACPVLRVLATSREPLRVPGEREAYVAPLPIADAGALLLDRAPRGALRAEEVEDVARICEALEGMPLAIELAAARLRVLTPAQVADRLDDQLSLLTRGSRSSPDRHRTLRATLAWSHDLLDEDERLVFRRLAVFAGGFTLDAAAEVCSDADIHGERVIGLVEQLTERSLVTRVPALGDTRLRLLEPIRQYAHEKLDAAEEPEVVGARHLEWATALAEYIGRSFFTDQIPSTHRLRTEHSNITRALDFAIATGRPESAVRIVAALGYPWFTIGQPDGAHWVDRAMSACPADAPARQRADALFASAMFAEQRWDHERAVPALHEALALYRASGRARSSAWVLTWLGRADREDLDGCAPADRFAQALDEFERLGDPAGIGWSLCFLAVAALRADDVELARERAESALRVARESGVRQVLGEAYRLLGAVEELEGHRERADQYLAEAFRAHREADDRFQYVSTLAEAAGIAIGRGQPDRAAACLTDALHIAEGFPDGQALFETVAWALVFLVANEMHEEAVALANALRSDDFDRLTAGISSRRADRLHILIADLRTDPNPHLSLADTAAKARELVARYNRVPTTPLHDS